MLLLRVNLNTLSHITKLRSKRQCTIYENELYELKYSFLKGTVENVIYVTPCKVNRNFQTSHFVAYRLFSNFRYLVGS